MQAPSRALLNLGVESVEKVPGGSDERFIFDMSARRLVLKLIEMIKRYGKRRVRRKGH